MVNWRTAEDFPPALTYFHQGSQGLIAFAAVAYLLQPIANCLCDRGQSFAGFFSERTSEFVGFGIFDVEHGSPSVDTF